MRELTNFEVEQVDGGVLPLLAIGAALLVSGCATIPVKKNPPSDCIVEGGEASGHCAE